MFPVATFQVCHSVNTVCDLTSTHMHAFQRSSFMSFQKVINPLFLICQHNFYLKMLLSTEEAPSWRMKRPNYIPRTFCDSVCKLLSSEYYQITAVRNQDLLKAHLKHALYKSFENEEFVALLKILIASRRLHYQIKRSLKTKFVYMFSSHQHRWNFRLLAARGQPCTCVIFECLLNKGQI